MSASFLVGHVYPELVDDAVGQMEATSASGAGRRL